MRLFSDQKDLLLTTMQGAGASIGDKIANEAVNQAYRKLPSCLPWAYLHRRSQINTVAPYATGTVSFVASTRIMTLTGGTWPSWASNGLIVIGQATYAIQLIIDSTHALLNASRCPVTDVSSTSYTLFQQEYILPPDFIRMEEIVEMNSVWTLYPVPPGSQLNSTRLFFNPARPWQYLVRGSTYFSGRMAMELGPPPNGHFVYDMSYYCQPRQPVMAVPYSTGTVTATGTAVVGVGTAFTQSMVGAGFRVSSTSSVPVGEYGVNGSLNEAFIATVTDATHLTLQTPIPNDTSAGMGFIIDDPVDTERGAMDEVFCRMCEYEFAVLTRSDRLEEKRLNMCRTLQNARAMDVRMSPRTGPFYAPTLDMVAYVNLAGR